MNVCVELSNGRNLHVLTATVISSNIVNMPWLHFKMNKVTSQWHADLALLVLSRHFQYTVSSPCSDYNDDNYLYQPHSNMLYLSMLKLLDHNDVMCCYIAHAMTNCYIHTVVT